uniref:Integrin, alpha 3a n=1 Tax=Sinocyclocheilus grahami TaxID=75366 RepID=A0A672T3X1_SINGR
ACCVKNFFSFFVSQIAITVVLRQLWLNTLPRDIFELNQVYTCFRLLVGAPKEKAESGVSANETGDVYACPITADTKDCRRLNLLNSNFEDPKNDVMDGMWLGVSIASQSQPGGRVLACGHRYVRNFATNFRMIGRCYVRGNDLQYNTADSQWQTYSEVCDPRDDQTSEGMCLAGMSAAITQTEIFLGAPGCFNWQGEGNLFSYMKSKLPNLKKGNIYIGKAGLQPYKDTVVTGAPRDEARGSVTMAEVFKASVSGEVKIKATVVGEQVGSYFGSSVTIVDLNNDGWKDLIVGAPFYFDRRKDEGGAVYVYMNQNESFRDKADVVLTGPKDSAFGMAVVGIGDVNQDGFQDFAVGAPYHSKGRVYIWMVYCKCKTFALTLIPQVIEGKDIPGGGFQTFGYSISGGMDVDGNSYPDIAVGSLDDRVVLLSVTVFFLVFSYRLYTLGFYVTSNVVKVMFIALFQYFVVFSAFQYTVEADQQSSRSPRVRFLDNKEGKYTGNMSVNPSGVCHSLKLELSKTIQDKVAPIAFLLSVSLVEPVPSGRQTLEDLSAFPVISQRYALTGRAEIHIQKACGSDNKCESNLQMMAAFTDEQNGLQIFHYSTEVKKLKLMVNVSNVKSQDRKAEDAYGALLNVTIPTSLSFSSLNPKVRSIDVLRNYTFVPSTFRTEYSGRVVGESAMKSSSDIGSPVEFNMTVALSGNPLGNLGFLEVVFQWPYAVANQKWLLYLSEIQMAGTSKQFCVPENNVVNPLNLTVSDWFYDYLSIDPAEAEELQYEVPLWIIIVSVLAGVILLGLIVILLWKCGFFKRANTRELYEAKAQKAEMKTQPSENNRLTEED